VELGDQWGRARRTRQAQDRDVIDTAKAEKTAVLFFDEFDGLGSDAEDLSGSMKGILAELKSQMDGFD
jgi:ATP-dependent 26S proteasome regulatory subunit